MKEDARAGLLSLMQEQGAMNNPPSLCIGTVISLDPLHIKVGDLVLEGDDLLLSDILLAHYTRTISLQVEGEATLSGTLTGVSGNSTHIGTLTTTLTGSIGFEDYLKKDDLIILIPTLDGQQYVALCKAVSL